MTGAAHLALVSAAMVAVTATAQAQLTLRKVVKAIGEQAGQTSRGDGTVQVLRHSPLAPAPPAPWRAGSLEATTTQAFACGTGSTPGRRTCAPHAELHADGVDVPLTALPIGDSARVVVHVTNYGRQSALETDARVVFCAADGAYGCAEADAVRLTIPALAPGMRVDLPVLLPVSDVHDAADRRIARVYLTVDPDRRVTDASRTTRTAQSAVIQLERPNAEIRDLALIDVRRGGAAAVADLRLVNVGTVAATPRTQLEFGGHACTPFGHTTAYRVDVPPLAAGQQLTLRVAIPWGTACRTLPYDGRVSVDAALDPNHLITWERYAATQRVETAAATR